MSISTATEKSFNEKRQMNEYIWVITYLVCEVIKRKEFPIPVYVLSMIKQLVRCHNFVLFLKFEKIYIFCWQLFKFLYLLKVTDLFYNALNTFFLSCYQFEIKGQVFSLFVESCTLFRKWYFVPFIFQIFLTWRKGFNIVDNEWNSRFLIFLFNVNAFNISA